MRDERVELLRDQIAEARADADFQARMVNGITQLAHTLPALSDFEKVELCARSDLLFSASYRERELQSKLAELLKDEPSRAPQAE